MPPSITERVAGILPTTPKHEQLREIPGPLEDGCSSSCSLSYRTSLMDPQDPRVAFLSSPFPLLFLSSPLLSLSHLVVQEFSFLHHSVLIPFQ